MKFFKKKIQLYRKELNKIGKKEKIIIAGILLASFLLGVAGTLIFQKLIP